MMLGRSRWCRKPSVIFFSTPLPIYPALDGIVSGCGCLGRVWPPNECHRGRSISRLSNYSIPSPNGHDTRRCMFFFLPGKQRRCASESVPVTPIVFITVITSAKKIGVPPGKPGLQSCKGPLIGQTGAKVTTKRPYLGVNSELCAEKSAI